MTTNNDITIRTDNIYQCYTNAIFSNTMETHEQNIEWHQPAGWNGFNYNVGKIHPVKEIIFILDFREIENYEYNMLSSPRFLLVVEGIDNQPTSFKYRDEELMQNTFTEMKTIQNSNKLLWYTQIKDGLTQIKDPPNAWILVRWKPKN